LSDFSTLSSDIFTLPLGFDSLCLSVFKVQSESNPVYKAFLDGLGVNPSSILKPADIPFLPIEFFKSQRVLTGSKEAQLIFSSSGTTGTVQSRHYVSEPHIYSESYLRAFQLFYGNPEEYCILALLPSYLEREGSSLILMTEDLIRRSKKADSGFYLNDRAALYTKLQAQEERGQKTILLGVTYALLDFAEEFKMDLKHTIVMETGGMKGRRKELIREELHAYLCERLGIDKVHSEYGMTELLSQAYSHGNGLFHCPPWLKVMPRDTSDPLSGARFGTTAGINIIDLANINSCSFISTQDLGKVYEDGSFEILGRFDNSEIRGCNLMVGF
jgi:phenylacetate-coenzyme A ligase PaaK-like adenylate-forming protein